MSSPHRSPLFVPDFEGCVPVERIEDLVGCEVRVEGGMRVVPYGVSVPFEGNVSVAGIQYHGPDALLLERPDHAFVELRDVPTRIEDEGGGERWETVRSKITGWVRSQKVVESVITFHELQDLSSDEHALFACALREADKANLGIGLRRMAAAVWCDDTKGTLSEHPLWGDKRCPEATLLFHAEEYGRLPAVRKIAIAGPSETLDDPDPRAPCGACRQRILECQEKTRGPIAVLFPGGYSQVARVERIEELLPLSSLR